MFGVPVYETEFISLNGKNGISTIQREDLKTLGELEKVQEKLSTDTLKSLYAKAQEGFLIDVLLSNYNVVGNSSQNMRVTEEGDVLRTGDKGRILTHLVGGFKKENNFKEIKEFDYMHSGLGGPFKGASDIKAIENASKVFNGIHDSPVLLKSLRKLLSVTDAELKNCVEMNSIAFLDDRVKEKDEAGNEINEGLSSDNSLIELLKARRKTIKERALLHIVGSLKNKSEEERIAYLQEALVDEKKIPSICGALENISQPELNDSKTLEKVYEVILDGITSNNPDNHLNIIEESETFKTLQKLKQLCETYKVHLNSTKNNPSDALLNNKLALVDKVSQALNKSSETEKSRFSLVVDILQKNEHILKKSRSGKISWFFQQVLSVLSAGLYTKLSKNTYSIFCKTHGEVFGEKVQKLLSDKSHQMNKPK